MKDLQYKVRQKETISSEEEIEEEVEEKTPPEDASTSPGRNLFNRLRMATKDAPPGDIQVSDVFSDTNVLGVIGLKSSKDLEQRKWFNAAMKKINHGGLNNVLCAEKEETLDTTHAELCSIFHHAIRMSVKDQDEARKHFFISKELEGTFNQGTLMKTRHTEKNSWSIVSSKTLELHLNISTPKALQTILDKNNNPKLLEAKKKYCAILARQDPKIEIETKDIVMDLVNIKCEHKLYNNTAGEEEVKDHLLDVHNITLGKICPSFTRGTDCKVYEPLDKIKSLPKPLTLPVVQSWAEDTSAEFREHGLVDNVEDISHMNTNPSQGRTIWDLLKTVMKTAQAASVKAHMKNQTYDITRNKSYPVN